MYIRKISRKNKDGSTVTYVQLAHNERDGSKGHPKAKILYNFGRLDTLDIEQLKRLINSISRFLPAKDVLESQVAIQNRGKKIKWAVCRSYGGVYLLHALWRQLNFDDVLQNRIASRSFTTPIVRAIFAMIANRCLAPSSKLAITDWVSKDVHIPDLATVETQVLYRAMDFLLLHQNKLEKEIYWAVADLMNLEVDLLFFDTTSSYFETEDEGDLKKRGYSKDKRSDLPQVIIGLAVTRSGIPVKHWIFPGNTQDMKTIETVKNDLSEWRLNRCIFVHDTGMTSESNLQYLQRGGGHYIVGRKMKSGDAYAEKALSHKGPYTNINENLWAKEIIVGDGEKRKRLVLVKNEREKERAEKTREKLMTKLETEINELNTHKQKGKSKASQKLKAHRVYGRYIKELKDGRLSLNRSRLRDETRYDGKYLIESSDDTLSISDIVLGYKQLYDVEHAFRTLKTTLELRPNYHSKDERIKCHIFLCFIALVFVRMVEQKTGKSWVRVRDEMNRLYYGEFIVDAKKICQLTEITNEQKAIFKALDIAKPSTIVDIRDK
jgi:transposase